MSLNLQAAATRHLLTLTGDDNLWIFTDADSGDILTLAPDELPADAEELDEVLVDFVEQCNADLV